MDKVRAKAEIRQLATAGHIAFTKHAEVRNPQQGKYPLTREQIKNCLLNGAITEGPSPDIKITDGWKITVTRFRGDEKHEVAAVLIETLRVLVITGYCWGRRQRHTLSRPSGDEKDDDDGPLSLH